MLKLLLGLVQYCWKKFIGTKTERLNAIHSTKSPATLYCDWVDTRLIVECQEHSYLVEYDRWYIPNTSYITYDLSCSISNSDFAKSLNVPQDFTYKPNWLETIIYRDLCKKLALNAYLESFK